MSPQIWHAANDIVGELAEIGHHGQVKEGCQGTLAPTGRENRQKHGHTLTGRRKSTRGQMRASGLRSAIDLALDQQLIFWTCRACEAGTSVCEGLK
jgi:hypothetical protein